MFHSQLAIVAEGYTFTRLIEHSDAVYDGPS